MFDSETGILRVPPALHREALRLSDRCQGPPQDDAAWLTGLGDLLGEETAAAMLRYHRATGEPIRLRVQWRDGSEG